MEFIILTPSALRTIVRTSYLDGSANGTFDSIEESAAYADREVTEGMVKAIADSCKTLYNLERDSQENSEQDGNPRSYGE